MPRKKAKASAEPELTLRDVLLHIEKVAREIGRPGKTRDRAPLHADRSATTQRDRARIRKRAEQAKKSKALRRSR